MATFKRGDYVDASSDDERLEIAWELRGHVVDAATCPHANFVVQKLIATLPVEELRFLVDGILESPSPLQVACNKYGCRVVQRLIERCSATQVQALVELLLEEVALLMRSTYGNYVVQCLLEHVGSSGQKQLMTAVHGHIYELLIKGPSGCAVLLSAMQREQGAERRKIAELIHEASLNPKMRMTSYTSVVVRDADEALNQDASQ